MNMNLTDAQVIQMGKLAIMASVPMGMGFLHYQPGLKAEDIQLEVRADGLFIDYYQGRMVKFYARKKEDGWHFPDAVSRDYQSWVDTYPSYDALVDAVKGK